MEKKEVVIDNPVTVDGITIIPVVHVFMNYWLDNGGVIVYGVKQPDAVIVVSLAGEKAFKITGEELSLEQLVEDVTGIKGILEKF